ncbi:hypothetical protein DESA109040_20060 [Deinococcus saxicola]|uniref:hypothetical protein n=1 Tax=Deinococcus saxicola TaxID=249406 RepID=UPI0039F0F08D
MECSAFFALIQLCAASGVTHQAIIAFVSGDPLGGDAIRLRNALPGLAWEALAGATSPATTEHVRTEKCAAKETP